ETPNPATPKSHRVRPADPLSDSGAVSSQGGSRLGRLATATSALERARAGAVKSCRPRVPSAGGLLCRREAGCNDAGFVGVDHGLHAVAQVELVEDSCDV